VEDSYAASSQAASYIVWKWRSVRSFHCWTAFRSRQKWSKVGNPDVRAMISVSWLCVGDRQFGAVLNQKSTASPCVLPSCPPGKRYPTPSFELQAAWYIVSYALANTIKGYFNTFVGASATAISICARRDFLILVQVG